MENFKVTTKQGLINILQTEMKENDKVIIFTVSTEEQHYHDISIIKQNK